MCLSLEQEAQSEGRDSFKIQQIISVSRDEGSASPGGDQGRNLTKNSDLAHSGCVPHSLSVVFSKVPKNLPLNSWNIYNISK